MGNWENRRFRVDNMEFDAAIDYYHELHHYDNMGMPEGTIPVELYNLSKNWDIYMIYLKEITDEAIINGIKEWITLDPVEYDEYIQEEEENNHEIDIHMLGGFTVDEVCEVIAVMHSAYNGTIKLDTAKHYLEDYLKDTRVTEFMNKIIK